MWRSPRPARAEDLPRRRARAARRAGCRAAPQARSGTSSAASTGGAIPGIIRPVAAGAGWAASGAGGSRSAARLAGAANVAACSSQGLGSALSGPGSSGAGALTVGCSWISRASKAAWASWSKTASSLGPIADESLASASISTTAPRLSAVGGTGGGVGMLDSSTMSSASMAISEESRSDISSGAAVGRRAQPHQLVHLAAKLVGIERLEDVLVGAQLESLVLLELGRHLVR